MENYFVSADLDDLIGLAAGAIRARLLIIEIVQMLIRLAICYQLHKCDLTLSENMKQLGFLLDITYM